MNEVSSAEEPNSKMTVSEMNNNQNSGNGEEVAYERTRSSSRTSVSSASSCHSDSSEDGELAATGFSESAGKGDVDKVSILKTVDHFVNCFVLLGARQADRCGRKFIEPGGYVLF